MENLIDRIKSKSTDIKAKRLHFFNKIKDLEKTLSEAVGGIPIHAQSATTDFETYGDGESLYGYLFYSDGELQIAYRTTEEDLEDSYKQVPYEESEYSVRKLDVCQIEWLEKLSTEESIRSLLVNVEKALYDVNDISAKSITSLEKSLDSESNIISDGNLEELKDFCDNNLNRQWIQARHKMLVDPSDSVTRTSSYLESLCKKILHDLSEPLPNILDITNLIKATINTVGIYNNKEVESDLKQLFGGIKGIFQAIGSLRTHFGTAHGSGPQPFIIDENIARLANDAAATVSVFIIKQFKKKIEESCKRSPSPEDRN